MCHLRDFAGVYQFIDNFSQHYPTLRVAFAGGDPRIRFFESEQQRDISIVDGTRQTEEDILRILEQGPDALSLTEKPVTVDVSKLSAEEIEKLLHDYSVPFVASEVESQTPGKSEL